MRIITFVRPLKTPRVLPVREDLDVRSTPGLKLAGGAVVAVTLLIVWIFR
ncbi:hypothetical protein [Microbulbifer rhizosphaerae]|uniref:Uncharacterized protein n=1 Tax=Microbulbifer rhizosphaerae TaxID=1562603 RepID=A0A7W4ZAC3_9GAMM|nr:hypothetical protein [Microbulbifer rhizosphaerae]MBB3062728.1 hypothetical protein [Microbulbifer rhizosphaerae]